MAQPKKTGLGKGLDALFGGVSIMSNHKKLLLKKKMK